MNEIPTELAPEDEVYIEFFQDRTRVPLPAVPRPVRRELFAYHAQTAHLFEHHRAIFDEIHGGGGGGGL